MSKLSIPLRNGAAIERFLHVILEAGVVQLGCGDIAITRKQSARANTFDGLIQKLDDMLDARADAAQLQEEKVGCSIALCLKLSQISCSYIIYRCFFWFAAV